MWMIWNIHRPSWLYLHRYAVPVIDFQVFLISTISSFGFNRLGSKLVGMFFDEERATLLFMSRKTLIITEYYSFHFFTTQLKAWGFSRVFKCSFGIGIVLKPKDFVPHRFVAPKYACPPKFVHIYATPCKILWYERNIGTIHKNRPTNFEPKRLKPKLDIVKKLKIEYRRLPIIGASDYRRFRL